MPTPKDINKIIQNLDKQTNINKQSLLTKLPDVKKGPNNNIIR